nr:MAG TPA: hypothetical protein [Caudoviricetes sp.]
MEVFLLPKQVKYLLCPFTGSECASTCALAGVIDDMRVCALACLSDSDKAIFKRNAHAPNVSERELEKMALRERAEMTRSLYEKGKLT